MCNNYEMLAERIAGDQVVFSSDKLVVQRGQSYHRWQRHREYPNIVNSVTSEL